MSRVATRCRESSGRARQGVAALATTLVLVLTAPGASAYDFHKTITIDRSHIPGGCPGTTQTNYPMLFSSTDANLRHTSFGGHVTDLQGDDIVFRALDAATCGGPAFCTLDHEIEKYDNTTGQLVAWVRLPSVNASTATSSTVIYMYYGDSAVTSSTQNPNGVWDANYGGVWHLKEATGVTAVDSTSNGNSAVPVVVAPTSATGQIGGALTFGATSHLRIADNLNNSLELTQATHPDWTMSAWVRPTDYSVRWPTIFAYGSYRASLGLSGTDQPPAGRIETWTNDVNPLFSNTSALAVNAWHYVTITRTTGTTRFYVNGSLDATRSPNTNTILGADRLSGIGADGNPPDSDSTEHFHGRIDEVRVSTTVRSACSINASYNNEVWPDKAVTPSPIPSPNPGSGFYGIGAEAATAVELMSFTATGLDSAVDLAWQTASETQNLGFQLYRSTAADGPWTQITASLIPGLGSSPEGASYGYRDSGLVNGTSYFYLLEDVETTGATRRHGPVSATPLAWLGDGGGGGEDGAPGDASRLSFGDPSRSSLQITQRSAGSLTLVLSTGGFFATPDPDGSLHLQIPGFDALPTPGTPDIPSRLAWVDALVGMRARIDSVQLDDVLAFEARPADAPAPALLVERDGTVAAARRPVAPRPRDTTALVPAEPALLLQTAFQGDSKKALLRLSPLRFDPASGRLLLARTLTVRLVFAGRAPEEIALGSTRGRLRPHLPQPAPGDTLAFLLTHERGLHAVAFDALFPDGAPGLRPFQLALSHQGTPVAFRVQPNPLRFEAGSRILFWSDGADANPDANEAVFRLARAPGGLTMPTRDAAPHGAPVAEIQATARFERNLRYQPALLEAPDLWLWDLVLSPGSKAFAFDLPGLLASSSSPARLSVALQGGSDFPTAGDHHLRFFVNGSLVTETSWDGMTPHAVSVELPAALLQETGNSLEILNLGDAGAAYSLVYLDRFALDYPRTTRARDGRLEGTAPLTGTLTLDAVVASASATPLVPVAAPARSSAAAFRSPLPGPAPELASGALLLDTTDTTLPLLLTGAVASLQLQPDGSSRDALAFRAEGGHRYLALAETALLSPEIRAPRPSSLRDTANAADWIVVAPDAFLDAAQNLADHRQAQGLDSRVVSIQDVFQDFGFGEAHPQALRDFLAFAFHNWAQPPRYVLLLGDATYDPKDFLNTGVESRIPSPSVPTSFLWTASDPLLAAVNGDDTLPDLALGRLSASTPDEAQLLVNKLIAWETAGFSLDGKAVLVSDNPDKAGDFDSDAQEIASTLLANRETLQIRLSELGKTATRNAIFSAFDHGASLLSYIGHGAAAVWASENLLNIWDLPSFAPQPEQPFVLTLNCLNGYFTMPTVDALAEALVKADGRGAIAALSPSSMSLNDAAHVYHKLLLAELVSGSHTRLGDALLAAQLAYADSGAFPELLDVYHLFGDPGTRIR